LVSGAGEGLAGAAAVESEAFAAGVAEGGGSGCAGFAVGDCAGCLADAGAVDCGEASSAAEAGAGGLAAEEAVGDGVAGVAVEVGGVEVEEIEAGEALGGGVADEAVRGGAARAGAAHWLKVEAPLTVDLAARFVSRQGRAREASGAGVEVVAGDAVSDPAVDVAELPVGGELVAVAAPAAGGCAGAEQAVADGAAGHAVPGGDPEAADAGLAGADGGAGEAIVDVAAGHTHQSCWGERVEVDAGGAGAGGGAGGAEGDGADIPDAGVGASEGVQPGPEAGGAHRAVVAGRAGDAPAI